MSADDKELADSLKYNYGHTTKKVVKAKRRTTKPYVGILALDLSSKGTGWAHTNGKSGTHYFDEGYKETPGLLFCMFDHWLEHQTSGSYYPTSLIVYESSLSQPGHAARVINGLVAITEMFCCKNKINVGHYHQSTIKKHATGSGKHPKGQSKAFMLEAAQRRNPRRKWTSKDHDEIDALFLLDLAIHDGAFLPQEK